MSFLRDSPALQFKSFNSLVLSLLSGPMFTSLHDSWKNYTLDFIDLRYMESKSESVSHSDMSNSLQPYGLQPTRLLYQWDSPGKNIGVGSHFLLQGIFLTQGLNSGLLHRRQILYHLSHQEIYDIGKEVQGLNVSSLSEGWNPIAFCDSLAFLLCLHLSS